MTELQIATKAVQLYAERHPRPIDVTQKQAAEMLNRSQPTIKKLIEAGTIKLNVDGRIPITEITRLESKKNKFTAVDELNEITRKNFKKTLNDPLLNQNAILLMAGKRQCICGVYFLIKDYEIVYVGQSVNIHQRLGDHLKTKDHDTFTYIECSKEDLSKLEALYIHKFKPKYNYNSLGQLVLPIRLNANDFVGN